MLVLKSLTKINYAGEVNWHEGLSCGSPTLNCPQNSIKYKSQVLRSTLECAVKANAKTKMEPNKPVNSHYI